MLTRRKIGLWLCMVLFSIAQLQAEDSPPTKSFIYKKTKQGDLEIVVHYPPGWKETDKRPGIVFFFGGGWTSGKIEQFEPQAKSSCQPGHGRRTGRLPGEVPARRHAEGMRRGCQECRSLDAAECRQARRRSRPDRGGRRIGGRAHRRLHRPHARPGRRRGRLPRSPRSPTPWSCSIRCCGSAASRS